MDHPPRLPPAPRSGALEARSVEGRFGGAAAVAARLLLTTAALLAASCAAPSTSAPASAAQEQTAIAWHPLGSWSGRGSTQTESFLVEGSVVRVRWETRNAVDGGTFKLMFLSAVSGRELAVAADQRGAGSGEFYIPEEPRPAYFLVESEDLDWSFKVDEGVAGTVREPAHP